MTWQLNHHFVGLPCERGRRLVRPRTWWRRERSIAGPCQRTEEGGVASAVKAGVTTLLAERGIDYEPAGEAGSWLWCLGGPSLYRRPLPEEYAEYGDADTCVDLNVWVCEHHRIVAAELFPFDMVAEEGGSGLDDPRTSSPEAIGDDGEGAVAAFLQRLEVWLDEILVLPGSE